MFETIWQSIDHRYYDPGFNGLDWVAMRDRFRPQVDTVTSDRSFYVLMNRMVGALRDAHTRVLPPQAVMNRDRQRTITIGVTIDSVDGWIVVTAVRPGSSADLAGIQPGMRLVRFNNTPIEERLAAVAARLPPSSSERSDRVRRYTAAVAGAQDSLVMLQLERADSSVIDVRLAVRAEADTPLVEARLLPSGVFYIHFTAFQPESQQEVLSAVRANAQASGMIIDLRDNPGGNSGPLNAIAGLFLDDHTPFLSYTQRQGDRIGPRQIVYTGTRGGAVYHGRIAILVSPRTGSSAEMFAGGLQQHRRAFVVGDTTCGCVLGRDKVRLKDGGELDIATVQWFDMDGRRLEGAGVAPNVVVRSGVTDLQRHRDVVLERADSMLRR